MSDYSMEVTSAGSLCHNRNLTTVAIILRTVRTEDLSSADSHPQLYLKTLWIKAYNKNEVFTIHATDIILLLWNVELSSPCKNIVLVFLTKLIFFERMIEDISYRI